MQALYHVWFPFPWSELSKAIDTIRNRIGNCIQLACAICVCREETRYLGNIVIEDMAVAASVSVVVTSDCER